VENSSNGQIFMKKTGEKLVLFQLKSGQKTGEIRILQEKKRAFSSFSFPFFLAVVTMLQVHPKTRLSITWP
jgi:hypothetical protein